MTSRDSPRARKLLHASPGRHAGVGLHWLHQSGGITQRGVVIRVGPHLVGTSRRVIELQAEVVGGKLCAVLVRSTLNSSCAANEAM